MVREALEAEGGVEYLRLQARERPEIFVQLLRKFLPQELELKVEKDTLVTLDFSGGRDGSLGQQAPGRGEYASLKA